MALPRDVDLPDRRPPPSPGDPRGGGTRPTTDPSQKAEVLGTALPMVIGTARVGPCPVIYWGAPLPGPGGRGVTWDIPYLADPATGLVRFYKGSINPAVYAVCEAPVTAVSKLYGPHFGLGVNPASSGLVYSTKGTLETIVADSGIAAWSGYVGTAAEGMAHQGTVQLRMTQCFSGEGCTPREFDAEVQGYGAGAGGESATGDAHPADVLVYLLTNTKNGLGLSSSMVNVDTGLPDANGNQTAANSYRRYCSARGWYVSIAVNERTAVTDLIASLLLVTDSALVLIGGKLTAVPYGDQVVTRSTFTYTPVGTAAVIDAAELIHEADDPPVEVDRRQEKDIFGIWPVEYVDRAVAYKRLTREYIDPVWTSVYGARRADATSIDWVITPEHAGWITHALAQRAIYQRNKYRFRLGPRWSLLTPMDLVSLSEPILGISSLIVRVTAIEEDADGTLSVEAIEWPTATAEPIDLTPQTADGVLTTNWRPIPSVPETQLNAGGGNLIPNSRLYDAGGGYGPWYKNTAADTASGQATGGPDGGTYQRLTWTATNAKHGWWAYVAGAMRPGVDYSISFYARAGSAIATGFEVTGDVAPYDMAAVENPNLTTSWQRYVFRGHWDPTVPTTYLLLRTAAIVAAAGTLDFACAQIEEGSVATGYQRQGGEVAAENVSVTSGTGWSVVGSFRRVGPMIVGTVTATATVGGGADWATVFTLPAGSRPLANTFVPGVIQHLGSNRPAMFTINASTGVCAGWGYDDGSAYVTPPTPSDYDYGAFAFVIPVL